MPIAGTNVADGASLYLNATDFEDSPPLMPHLFYGAGQLKC